MRQQNALLLRIADRLPIVDRNEPLSVVEPDRRPVLTRARGSARRQRAVEDRAPCPCSIDGKSPLQDIGLSKTNCEHFVLCSCYVQYSAIRAVFVGEF